MCTVNYKQSHQFFSHLTTTSNSKLLNKTQRTRQNLAENNNDRTMMTGEMECHFSPHYSILLNHSEQNKKVTNTWRNPHITHTNLVFLFHGPCSTVSGQTGQDKCLGKSSTKASWVLTGLDDSSIQPVNSLCSKRDKSFAGSLKV